MDIAVRDDSETNEHARGVMGRSDPRVLIAVFRRNLKLFLAVLLSVVALTIVVTFLVTPKYTASAGVLLDPRKHQVTGIQSVLSDLPADTSIVDTEVEVLKSRALAERVVSSFKLDQDPEFNPSLRKPGPLGALFGGLKGAFSGPPAPPSALELQKRHDAIVSGVLSRLKVQRSRLTYLMSVSFESVDPAKAAKLANAFADSYLLEQLEAKFDATKNANDWLNTRLTDLRAQVEKADAAVEAYKAANGLLSAEGSTGAQQEITNLNQQLAQVKVQEAEADARLKTAREQLAHGSNGDDLGAALESGTISQLRQQRAQVSGALAQLQSRYGARHPDVVKAERQLADIDAQIQAEIRRLISNLEAQDQVAHQRTASLMRSLAGSRGTLSANNRAGVRLAELQRNAESVSALYQTYLTRFKQTGSQEDLQQSDARVVSRAMIPSKPSSPILMLNLALGLMLGFGAGVGAIVAREALETGVATAEEIEAKFDIPCLAGIPSLASIVDDSAAGAINPTDYVMDKPLSTYAEGFRSLRTSLLLSRLGVKVKVIAITSAMPDEGKTTTAVCLMRVMAMAGDRVILIDGDLRKRAVSRAIAGDEPDVGLLEVLAGTATLEQAVRVDERSGAHYLPVANSSYTPKDVFGTAAMDQLLDQLRAQYDYVVIDTAPVLPVADTRVIASKVDVVALLVRWRKSPANATLAGLKLLQAANAHIAGAALTQINMKEQVRYGYGDPGYYYRSYQKYYSE